MLSFFVATRSTSKTRTTKTSIESPVLSSVNTSKTRFINRLRDTNSFIIFLSVFIIALVIVFFLKKSWLVAATVDGNPVTSIELQQRLNQDYRKQVLDQLVNEKIVDNEAKKNNIVISQTDINSKMNEYETKYGGPTQFDQILEQQGTTRSALQDLIKTQLILEKLYSGEVLVSAQEVTDYIKTNKQVLTASDEAGQNAEATDNIKQQKLFQVFSQKFQELKDKAKVSIF